MLGYETIEGSVPMKTIQVRIFTLLFLLGWMIPQLVTPAAGAQQATKKAAKSAEEMKKEVPKIDINSASKDDLMKLSGIGTAYADAIVKHRPYKRKDELTTKKVIPQATYDKIKDLIIAKQ
jgi:DNA uptake protein ComE-like DNA-binding protein